MTFFSKSGDSYRVLPNQSGDISETLPAGNYVLKHAMMVGYYLEITDSFKLPKKLYGNCVRQADRILYTFRQRDKNTGVLLVGEKGSGKTLLSKQIAISSGMPTIIINEKFTGDEFNSFLASITQQCVVLFDEFEKIYDREAQEKVLTLLDGTYQSRKLFLITSNDKWGLDMNLRNRPGRIYYHIEFSGLGEAFIREYCCDNLAKVEKTEDVVRVASMFDQFNFDMLASVVEEVNRYDEDPMELISILNVKPEYSGKVAYKPSMVLGDFYLPSSMFQHEKIHVNSTTDSVTLRLKVVYSVKADDELDDAISDALYGDKVNPAQLSEWISKGLVHFGDKSPWGENVEVDQTSVGIRFAPEDIIRYEGVNSVVYKNEEGFEATLTKVAPKTKTALFF